MKKSFSLLLCILLTMALVAPASRCEQVLAISFRGYRWYAHFAEIDEQMSSISNELPSVYTDTTIDHYTRAEWSSTFSKDYVDNGGVCVFYDDIPVAGYTADQATLYFMYTLGEDGRVFRDDNNAEFYFAMYYFKEIKDLRATYVDLKTKLTSLYGKGKSVEKEKKSNTKWTDDAGNIAWLVMDNNADEIRLVYSAGGSDDRLDALQAQIKAEAMETEKAKREENLSDTSGL